jgi:hypothetical protein
MLALFRNGQTQCIEAGEQWGDDLEVTLAAQGPGSARLLRVIREGSTSRLSVI